MQQLCEADIKLISGGTLYLGGDWKHNQGLLVGAWRGGCCCLLGLMALSQDPPMLLSVAASIVIIATAIGFAQGYYSWMYNYSFLENDGLYDIQFNMSTGYVFQKI